MLNYRLVNQNYLQVYHIFTVSFQLKSKCYNVDDTKQCLHLTDFDLYPQWIDGWITPSSHRPCAEIIKMAFHEPIMQPIIDWFGQTDDWLWTTSRVPTQVYTHYTSVHPLHKCTPTTPSTGEPSAHTNGDIFVPVSRHSANVHR